MSPYSGTTTNNWITPTYTNTTVCSKILTQDELSDIKVRLNNKFELYEKLKNKLNKIEGE